ncbi:hypothetical protein QQZ08_006454 [Neonectria magnoliae]|uniref:Uncharacterized protein n=1 Tax=Neonectria magnoliae TaxID=2732573 RepID=A0ABR1I266_9HYPO
MAQAIDLSKFSKNAPARPPLQLQFADVAVTATANEFKGIYRNKQSHDPDFEHTVDRARDAGVGKLMLTGMSLADVAFHGELARSRPSQCHYTIGVHPYHASELDEGGKEHVDRLEREVKDALAQDPVRIAAFGELGLDYDREVHASKEVQIRAFKAQLDLFVTNDWNLPLFLHCRAAFEDFVDIITPYLEKLPRRGLVHSFVGSTAQMEKLVGLGFDISDQETLEMVSKIPLERLQIETDAPWGELKATSDLVKRYCANATPLPAAKKKEKWDPECMIKERNESCTLERVAYIVAGLKGIGVQEVADAAWKNSIRMFGLGEKVDES